MNTSTANLINSATLIILGIWGYLDSNSLTAFIPVFFGVIMLLCNKGLKKENKTIAHIVVLLTAIILIALVGMRLPKYFEIDGWTIIVNWDLGLYRVIFMIATSTIAMRTFIKSFIKARSDN